VSEHGNIIDKSDDWYTPAYVFDALGCSFDLDVSSPPEGPRYVPARNWFWERGLEQNWFGFVWMNPPFGHMATKYAWLKKFIEHDNGIALMPDRTSAPWWQWAAPKMDALLFVAPKIQFERPDGSIGKGPGSGSVLMARGDGAVIALMNAEAKGLGVAVPMLRAKAAA
jgi:hypothetical protein